MNFSLYSRIKRLGKLTLSYPRFFEIFRRIKCGKNDRFRRAILIGSPVHCNIGDHLIASECVKYLEQIGFDQLIEVPEFVYELFPSRIKPEINDLIFICGGGWMGEDYEDELVIEDILQRYPENHIVILPQTIHITNGNHECISRMSKVLNQSERIILTLREPNSYSLAKELLAVPDDRLFLLPDMGLLRSQVVKENHTSNSVIFSIRDDVEKVDNDAIAFLRDYFNSKGANVSDSSTVIHTGYISFTGRDEVIEAKINEFSHADVVVTDRLHTMILALIAGTKCIAFDNATHKVAGVATKWLTDCPLLFLCTDSDLDRSALSEFLNKPNEKYEHDFINEFKPLITYVRNIIDGNIK